MSFTTPEAQIIVETIKSVSDCFKTYLEVKESNETERQRIRATLEAYSITLSAKHSVINRAMDEVFADRNKMYELGKQVMNKALELSDLEMLKITMGFLQNIYNKNPFDGMEQISNFSDVSVKAINRQ